MTELLMTTNAAMPLPMITPPLRTQPSEDTARTCRPHPQQATGSETADPRGAEQTDACGDTDVSAKPLDTASDRKGSFADALKKRLKTNDSGPDKTCKDTDDAETPRATDAAAAFHAQAAAPIAIKTLSGQSEKAPATPAFHADTATGTYAQRVRKPVAHADETLTGKASGKVEDALGKSAWEKQPANEQPVAEKAASALQQSTERLSRPEQAAGGNPKTLNTSPPATEKPVDTLTTKNAAEGPQPENTRPLAQFVRIGNTDMQSTESKSEPDTSLKNSLARASTLKSEQSADPESQAEGIKILQGMNVKELSSAAAEGAKAITAIDSPSAGATPAVQSSGTMPHGESAKGNHDIAAARPIDQIVQTLQLRTFGAEPHVRMMLAPEELGAIRITFRQVDSEVVGLLEVQKNETRKEIERSVTQLTAAMETAGVHVRRIEVVGWNNNAAQNPRGEQFSQDFDARNHQEMYRPSDHNSPQNHSKKGVTDHPEGRAFEADPSKKHSTGRSETGLNFFI